LAASGLAQGPGAFKRKTGGMMESKSTIVKSTEQFTVRCFHAVANRVREIAKERQWSAGKTIQNLVILGIEKYQEKAGKNEISRG
jgi:hypothetical protein